MPEKMNDFKVMLIILGTALVTMLLTSLTMSPPDDVIVREVFDATCKAHGNGTVALDIYDFDGGFTVQCAKDWKEVVLWDNTTS